MQIAELIAESHAGRVRALDLLSLEGGFYLLDIHTVLGRRQLVDGQGRAMRLRSVEHARDLLEAVAELPFHLVHASAYDEMCGLAEGRREPLRVSIGLRSAWGEVGLPPSEG